MCKLTVYRVADPVLVYIQIKIPLNRFFSSTIWITKYWIKFNGRIRFFLTVGSASLNKKDEYPRFFILNSINECFNAFILTMRYFILFGDEISTLGEVPTIILSVQEVVDNFIK